MSQTITQLARIQTFTLVNGKAFEDNTGSAIDPGPLESIKSLPLSQPIECVNYRNFNLVLLRETGRRAFTSFFGIEVIVPMTDPGLSKDIKRLFAF